MTQKEIKFKAEYTPSFYNTTNQKGEILKTSRKQAKAQEDVIYEYFKRNHQKIYTPFNIQRALALTHTPITSIRRAITNLTDKGYLIKTTTQQIGEFGKPNYCWKFKEK